MHMVLTEGDLDSQQETSDQHPAQLHKVEEPEAVAASEQVGGPGSVFVVAGSSR